MFPWSSSETISKDTSSDLFSVLEGISENIKIMLLKIDDMYREIEELNIWERWNTIFANNIIKLWDDYHEIFFIICKQWCEKQYQLIDKIGQLKEEFDLDINYFKVGKLIWHMMKFFQNLWNNKLLPINVTNAIICPVFWCSQEEEKKIALWWAYQ